MKKKKLILHIGSSKTGTTYIQNFLDVNRGVLYSDHKILYPNFSETNLSSGSLRNHSKWYQNIRNDENKFINEIKRLVDFTTANSINIVILSNEGWLFDQTFTPLFSKLLSSTNDFHLKTICYLRRIDHWAESTWKQFGLKKFDNVEEYFKHLDIENKYELIYNRLNNWSNCVGVENIIVRPYENQQLSKGILYDFFTQIGVDFNQSDWDKTSDQNKNLNSGFNRDVLELLHYCRDLYKDVHDNRLFGLLTNLLGENFQKKPFEEYSLLSPKHRIEIIESNRPFEELIAKKFMDRENGNIFLDPLPKIDDEYQPYEGLTLEKAIPIIIKMIDKNNEIINKQRKMNKKNSINWLNFDKKNVTSNNSLWGKLINFFSKSRIEFK